MRLLAVLVAAAVADGEDLALLGLLLGGVGEDDAAGGRLLLLDRPHDQPIAQGLELHVMKPPERGSLCVGVLQRRGDWHSTGESARRCGHPSGTRARAARHAGTPFTGVPQIGVGASRPSARRRCGLSVDPARSRSPDHVLFQLRAPWGAPGRPRRARRARVALAALVHDQAPGHRSATRSAASARAGAHRRAGADAAPRPAPTASPARSRACSRASRPIMPEEITANGWTAMSGGDIGLAVAAAPRRAARDRRRRRELRRARRPRRRGRG